ncbi:MAG: hypothetical protein WDO24_31420 [Pseudomonadota bacterium]
MRRTLIGLLLALALSPAAAETAKSLDKVPGLLKTPEAKDKFAQQMDGKPASDGLGLQLPAGLEASAISALLLPPGTAEPLNAAGAKPLPGRTDIYVAIACTGGDVPTSPNDTKCSQFQNHDAKPELRAYLGVIEIKASTAPRLVAKPVMVSGPVDWDVAPWLHGPDEDRSPDSFDRFDLAAYQISPTQRAFGLRGAWTEGYSGGMKAYSALYLFAVVDGALTQVLSTPMSYYSDIAGDWHKDGTREHDIDEGAGILIVSKHSTSDHFDLTLENRTGKESQLLQWSAAPGRYAFVKK